MSSEASQNISPAVARFQLTFIPGRMTSLSMYTHFFAVDVTETSGYVHQLVAHCSSLGHRASPPTCDKSLIDRCRFIPPRVPVGAVVDPQPSPLRDPDWLSCAWL